MTFPDLERPGQAHVDLRTSYSGNAHGAHCSVSAVCRYRKSQWIEPLRTALARRKYITEKLVSALVGRTRQGPIRAGGHIEILAGQQLHDSRDLPFTEQNLQRSIREFRCLIHRGRIESLPSFCTAAAAGGRPILSLHDALPNLVN